MSALYAGIEAGGTKFVCGVGRGPTDILASISTPTRSPDETMAAVTAFFRAAQQTHGPIESLGLASFGPLDLDPASPRYGAIVRTPKPGWSGFNLRAAVADALGVPVAIDTDVAGAGLAEAHLGAGVGLRAIAYVTVGTGVGGALVIDGRPAHFSRHPEMGHIWLRRHALDNGFAGVCPYHRDCLEGLASGPAVTARLGAPLSQAPAGAPIWTILSEYLAQACLNIALIATPDRIVMGGGVLSNRALFPLIRQAVLRLNNGYMSWLDCADRVDAFIVPPALGDQAGLAGALLMAQATRLRPSA